jgi:hypothetical protein
MSLVYALPPVAGRVFKIVAIGGRTMVKHKPHQPQVEGSSPVPFFSPLLQKLSLIDTRVFQIVAFDDMTVVEHLPHYPKVIC